MSEFIFSNVKNLSNKREQYKINRQIYFYCRVEVLSTKSKVKKKIVKGKENRDFFCLSP